jgi:hypothetical protein
LGLCQSSISARVLEDELLPDRIHSIYRENGTKASKRKVDVVQVLDPFFSSPPREGGGASEQGQEFTDDHERETAYTMTQVTMVLKRTSGALAWHCGRNSISWCTGNRLEPKATRPRCPLLCVA